MLMRFINHHITPLNIAVSEVLEKAVLIAKHLITVCLLPRSLLFDARGSVSNFDNVPKFGMEVLHSPYRRRLGGWRWLVPAKQGRPLPRQPPRRRRYGFCPLVIPNFWTLSKFHVEIPGKGDNVRVIARNAVLLDQRQDR